MASDGTVKIDTDLDSSGLKSGLSGMGATLSKVGGFAASGFAAITTGVAATSAALGAAAGIGMNYNATMEDYFANFETMLGSAEGATNLVSQLKTMGASTPFEMTDLADASKTLLAFGEDTDSLMGDLQMLGDISLGNSEKFSSLSLVFGQVQSQGKLMGSDLLQMINSGFNPLQVISEQTGESMASLKEKMADGQISFEMVSEAMKTATSEGGQFYGAMEKSSQTFNGMVSTLKDNTMSLVGEVAAPLSEMATTTLIPAALDAINGLTEAFQTGGTDGLIAAGGKILGDIVGGIATAMPGIVTMAINLISSIASSLSAQGPALWSAGSQILTTIASAIVSAIPGLTTTALNIIMMLVSGLANNMPSIANTGIDILLELIGGISDKLPELIPMVFSIITSIIKAIWDHMPEILTAGADLLVNLIQGLLNSIPILWAMLPEVIDAIINFFEETDWGEIGKNIMNGIGKGLINAVSSTVKAAKEAVGSVVDGVKNFLGIHSPSTVMRDLIGKNMMAGISVGVNDEAPSMINDVKRNVARLVSGVQAEVNRIGARIGIGSTTGAASKTTEETDKIDYEKLGSAVTKSFVSAGIGISLNGREFGRVIADLD